ncbi:MAG TPA: aconitase family protein [Pyrinomonadaceae bacterium]|nr:aconitase family protein [Pyrinomonadaceae bacterium]
MTAEKTTKRPARLKFDGRVLYLTEDVSLVRRQLEEGTDLEFDPARPLMNNISTDEITPGWVCFYYDETLGEYVYVGMREGAVKKDEVRNGGFAVVVSGLSKGCGSSRETAPFAERSAGLRLVIAETIEKIYGQNCQNIGLLTSTDFGLVERIGRGEEIPLEEFTRGLDPISRQIVEYGGLFNYNKARLAGHVEPPALDTPPRPMNIVEKIIARHAFVRAGEAGVAAVKPGDALFAVADVRFSHEYVTPMAESLFKQALGPEARVTEAHSVYAFRDHLTFLGRVMPDEKKKMGLLERADGLATTQAHFTEEQGIRLYGESADGGSEAICHNAVVEDLALPGQLVIGTDSHTCMAGVLGCFAFGVGSTDMANAWYTKDIRVRVPEVVRFVLKGRRPSDVSAKDVMLVILATDYMKQGRGIGQVLEFAGEGLADWSIDERATLTNMAVEAGGFTGIIEPDEVTLRYLVESRGISEEAAREGFLRSDPDAEYAAAFEIDLSGVRPMVALPGDPRNGIPVEEMAEPVRIDIAYGGSCTGGKMADMDMYAAVLRRAVEQGRRVAPGVHLYLQFGSQKIKQYARERGYIDIFERAGAEMIDPSCGACINAGPGASRDAAQVTVSAQNRNFPGRSGPGQVYLASPYVVAASAIEGHIVAPGDFLAAPEEELVEA